MNSSRKLKFAALGAGALLVLFSSTWFGADFLVKVASKPQDSPGRMPNEAGFPGG